MQDILVAHLLSTPVTLSYTTYFYCSQQLPRRSASYLVASGSTNCTGRPPSPTYATHSELRKALKGCGTPVLPRDREMWHGATLESWRQGVSLSTCKHRQPPPSNRYLARNHTLTIGTGRREVPERQFEPTAHVGWLLTFPAPRTASPSVTPIKGISVPVASSSSTCCCCRNSSRRTARSVSGGINSSRMDPDHCAHSANR